MKNDETINEETELAESPIEESKRVLEELKEQNRILKENLAKAETLHAERLLSGSSSAGKREYSEEEKAIEAARNLIKGSGFEDMAFPES